MDLNTDIEIVKHFRQYFNEKIASEKGVVLAPHEAWVRLENRFYTIQRAFTIKF